LEGAWFRLREGLTGSDIPLMAGLSWIKRDDRGRVNLGKFTFFVLVVGLAIVAVPTGLMASALTQARDDEKEK